MITTDDNGEFALLLINAVAAGKLYILETQREPTNLKRIAFLDGLWRELTHHAFDAIAAAGETPSEEMIAVFQRRLIARASGE